MLKVTLLACCAIFFSSASLAGIVFKDACEMYSGAVLKKNLPVTEIYSLRIYNDFYPVTIKAGNYHYSISKFNRTVYDIAKMTYFFGINVDVCVKSKVNGGIDELLGIKVTE